MSKFKSRLNRVDSAKFPTVGTTVEGTVLVIAEAPVPEFGAAARPTGPKTNIDGSIYTQIDITLNTPDGVVVLHTGGQMFEAIDDALDKAGLENLVTGHELSVTYVAAGAINTGGVPSKVYTAVVTPASPAQ